MLQSMWSIYTGKDQWSRGVSNEYSLGQRIAQLRCNIYLQCHFQGLKYCYWNVGQWRRWHCRRSDGALGRYKHWHAFKNAQLSSESEQHWTLLWVATTITFGNLYLLYMCIVNYSYFRRVSINKQKVIKNVRIAYTYLRRKCSKSNLIEIFVH